ncbi:class I SAM-dependent methyltransferase [Krasilnikovia sp. MM14-A1259]|uniref:class I SAM-dependent methyltransferase n=1 Tax=Krasilnikovia sp. MM14-A1259 TaxID=3373539 RepID=UPI0038257653
MYAKFKAARFDAEPYAQFVTAVGEPGLEIGCGDGEPLLTLRRKGLDVEGLDSSGDMLERCRINAAATGIDVTLHHQRMEQMSLPKRYRSIYLAGPTFNLLPDDETALQALRAIREHLTSDGAALIPLWIPEPTLSDEFGVTREAIEADGTVLRYTAVSEVYDETARNRVTTTRYERITPNATDSIEREWNLHWYGTERFEAMCSEAGLSVTAMVDDEGRAVSPQATEFTVTVQPG